jgi:hypothetical protein
MWCVYFSLISFNNHFYTLISSYLELLGFILLEYILLYYSGFIFTLKIFVALPLFHAFLCAHSSLLVTSFTITMLLVFLLHLICFMSLKTCWISLVRPLINFFSIFSLLWIFFVLALCCLYKHSTFISSLFVIFFSLFIHSLFNLD